jgi:hypothetical protein
MFAKTLLLAALGFIAFPAYAGNDWIDDPNSDLSNVFSKNPTHSLADITDAAAHDAREYYRAHPETEAKIEVTDRIGKELAMKHHLKFGDSGLFKLYRSKFAISLLNLLKGENQ